MSITRTLLHPVLRELASEARSERSERSRRPDSLRPVPGKILTTTLFAAALASACGSGDGEGKQPAAETKTASLRGRIAEPARAPLVGATLTAYRVAASGVATALPTITAELGDDGRYQLTVDVTAGAVDTLLVRAKAGAAQAAVLASAPLAADASVVLAPMDVETSAEADVLLAALSVAGTDHRGLVARELVRAFVTPALAVEVAAGNREVNVRTTARALVAGLSARAAYLGSDAAGVSAEQLALLGKDTASAQRTLDLALDAATSTRAVAAAQATYVGAVEAAYASAAIFPEDRAGARHALVEALRPYAAPSTAALRPALLAAVELDRVAEVTTLVAGELSALELDAEEQRSMIDAGRALEADVRAALAAGADAEVALRAAWSTYAAAISTELELSLPIAQRVRYLEVQLAIQGAGSALGASFADLTAVAAPFTTGVAAATAVEAYRAAVLSDTNVTTLMSASVSADRARAMTEVLFTLGAATRGRDVTAE